MSARLLFRICSAGCLIFRHIDTPTTRDEHAAESILEDKMFVCFVPLLCSWLLHVHEIHDQSASDLGVLTVLLLPFESHSYFGILACSPTSLRQVIDRGAVKPAESYFLLLQAKQFAVCPCAAL